MEPAPAPPRQFATWSQRILHHLLSDSDRDAIVSMNHERIESWTRAELVARTAGASDYLDVHGVQAGDCVPALLTSQPHSVALLIAGALTRRPLAPLAPRVTHREVFASLKNISGPVLVTEPQYRDFASELAKATGKRIAVVDEIGAGNVALGADARRPEDIACMLHTSGTTGLPKPVPVPEGPFERRAEILGQLCGFNGDARYVTAALFHHVAGLGNLMPALANGASIILIPPLSVDLWRNLASAAPTHTTLVPSVIEMLLEEGVPAPPSLRVLAYGGSSIHPDTVRRMQKVMPAVDLINLFGQTEGSPVTVLNADDHRRAAAGQEGLLSSVGRPAPGVELRLNEPDANGIGEIWARSDHSFVVDEQGWQRTGDLGRVVDDFVYLVGRRGDKIIRGGENVFPLEVEQILETHPDVVSAGVVGKPDRRLGETIVAFVVPVDVEEPPDSENLRVHCRAQLAGFKVPVEWIFVDRLPRNPNGKLLRGELSRELARRTSCGAKGHRVIWQ
ncbi:class I adenylate-forming enzyme family protein [Mycobacterium sp. UM_CSW]|uniref:class I adenylate-forming enzyme family protein n=1 Tax=Mycobacterium sp. UM_CSW TaxID=1370119 RepID=UPI000425CD72|nr:class I adenylate-forming enzyme family protein [Mycobacterium sp. UM_CSW]